MVTSMSNLTTATAPIEVSAVSAESDLESFLLSGEGLSSRTTTTNTLTTDRSDLGNEYFNDENRSSSLLLLRFESPLIPSMALIPTPRAIIRHLECPVCFDICVGRRFFTCVTGHAFCDDCFGGFSLCPLCRGEFLGGRAYGLESLANDVILACRFQSAGCKLILKGSCWREHKENCDYRSITCTALDLNTFLPCGYQSVSLRDFNGHIAEEGHRAVEFYTSDSGSNTILVPLQIHHIKTSGTHPSHVICCVLVNGDGKRYLMSARYVGTQKTLNVWVSYIGRPSEAMDKEFELVIKHASTNKLSVVYKAPIRSAHLTADEVEEEGFVAYIPKTLAKNYAGSNSELLCELKIVQVPLQNLGS